MTPAEQWLALDPDDPAIAKAFGLPQDGPGARFALYPFRVARVDGVWHVQAAWPCPRTIGALDTDASGIVAVLAWNPQTHAVQTLGDPQPQLVGRLDRDYSAVATLYGQPVPFFRAWIAARLAYWRFVTEGSARVHELGAEPDLVPGALAVGDLRQIRLPVSAMPREVTCVGISPALVNRCIQNVARLPYAAKAQAIGKAA